MLFVSYPNWHACRKRKGKKSCDDTQNTGKGTLKYNNTQLGFFFSRALHLK